jgi:uncharacterized protein YegJ (DUF2314 family)
MQCRHVVLFASVLAIFGLAASSCKQADREPADAPSGPSFSPTVDIIRYQFAVYYLPKPKSDAMSVLKATARREFPAFKLVAKLPEKPLGACLACRLETSVAKNYAPLDTGSLKHFGRGLSQSQAQSLQKSERAIILDFAHPKRGAFSGLKAANSLVCTLARKTNGLIWDEATREVFTPDAWESQRIKPWVGETPAVISQVTIHAYRDGEYVRAITLGMAKLGLPDVVVNKFAQSSGRQMVGLIHLFSQAMVEGAPIPENGVFDLDVKAINDPDVRNPIVESLEAGALGRVRVTLKEGAQEEGDPANRLIEIRFDRFEGPDIHAKQDKALSEFFGSRDSVVEVKHSDELLAASRKARAKLPSLREAFQKGLPAGEVIQVKAPFNTPEGGREWMWVEVTAWNGDSIRGLLQNDPENVPDLKSGQVVTVSQSDVFDYILVHAGGTTEGNETGEILTRQSQEK